MPASRHAAEVAAANNAAIDRLAAAGLRFAAGYIKRVRADALRAYRGGRDPAAAIRQHMAGVSDVLADAMTASHLRGRMNTAAGIKRATLSLSVYDDAIKSLVRRLGMTPAELGEVKARYDGAAVTATQDAFGLLEGNVLEAVKVGVQEGVTTQDGMRLVREAFRASGVDDVSPHLWQTLFRTESAKAYGAAEWESVNDPDVSGEVWGFEWVTFGDDRVRESHAAMDGVRRPKDDPIWQRWSPPSGFNCRCSRIPIMMGDPLATPTTVPNVEPDDGFAVNWGTVFAGVGV
jgi:SPP1 gp7 family putative phage head morphogenesis protein